MVAVSYQNIGSNAKGQTGERPKSWNIEEGFPGSPTLVAGGTPMTLKDICHQGWKKEV